jgi:hypothetical protein
MLEDTPGITATTYDAELNALSGRGKRRLSGVLLDLSDRQKVRGAQPGTTALRTALRPDWLRHCS